MGFKRAGLLMGLGQGLAEVGKSIEERRQAAIEAARADAKEARAAATRTAERAEDRTDKVTDTATEQVNAIARIDATGAQQTALQGTRLTHDASQGSLDRQQQVDLAGINFNNTVTLENLRSSNDRAETRAAAALEVWKDANKTTTIDRYVQDTEGQYIGLSMGNGGITKVPTGVKGPLQADPALGGLPPPGGTATAAAPPPPLPTRGASPERQAAMNTVYNTVRDEHPDWNETQLKAEAKKVYKRLYP